MATKKKPARKVRSLPAKKVSAGKAKTVKGGAGWQDQKKW